MTGALDRTALIGQASSWTNWTAQSAIYGSGAALCWTSLDGVTGGLVTLVVLVSLAEGAARLARRTGNA